MIGPGRGLLGAHCPFTGVTWFKGPEERSSECRPPDMDIAEGDSEPVSLLLHRGKTSFIRKGPSTEKDRLAGLTVEDSKWFRTSGKA